MCSSPILPYASLAGFRRRMFPLHEAKRQLWERLRRSSGRWVLPALADARPLPWSVGRQRVLGRCDENRRALTVSLADSMMRSVRSYRPHSMNRKRNPTNGVRLVSESLPRQAVGSACLILPAQAPCSAE
jgi:hypothetical protein